ncbi:hypothetical protein OJ252_2062 [Cryptosporidium canis]|uniref:Uncharacterized protein n=1 Tax=Cryptosporidium canis TaxID=195482 RepID=A0ABQ8P6L1_9CRYT|nr:hypothetical protein OJ252_2062 [Cryptosporidium canis]
MIEMWTHITKIHMSNKFLTKLVIGMLHRTTCWAEQGGMNENASQNSLHERDGVGRKDCQEREPKFVEQEVVQDAAIQAVANLFPIQNEHKDDKPDPEIERIVRLAGNRREMDVCVWRGARLLILADYAKVASFQGVEYVLVNVGVGQQEVAEDLDALHEDENHQAWGLEDAKAVKLLEVPKEEALQVGGNCYYKGANSNE